MANARNLPAWAERVRRKYVGGEASMFLLHTNVFDRVLFGGSYYSLTEFLAKILLWENKQNILVYDPALGVSCLKASPAVAKIDELRLRRSPKDVLPLLEAVLFSADSTALIIPYVGVMVPDGEYNLLSEQDRNSLITLHRWSLSPELREKDNVVFLVSEALSEVNQRLVANPVIAAVQVPMPDIEARREVVQKSDPSIDAAHVRLLSEHTAGLRAVQIAALLTPQPIDALEDGERQRLIESLLIGSVDAKQRAEKLGALTRGMDAEQIRHLINPSHAVPQAEKADAYSEVLALVSQRKRELIEKECYGLIEFIEPRHDLSAVGGNEAIKEELRQIAANIRAGDTARVPMGLLFVGPMGTGKTFVANAFIKESGLSAVKLKNFRSKWVGSTEANLEKVLGMVKSLGPIVLVIDEGDRAFGSEGGEDGGTSSRVMARIKEFMSDPENRGQVLFLLMTNRPDKLDIDIKRAGRLDRKIPFFYPDQAEDVEKVLDALLGRYQVEHELDWRQVRGTTSARLLGYSNADLEAVVLLANDTARTQGSKVTPALLEAAVTDYLPSRDQRMLEYMELLAVFETSRRALLPERFRTLAAEELGFRLAKLRAELGIR
ncbi:MAG: ATP-binding protein [Polyangiaceae bacterium]|nr:ATP-binding protein [Polyangiaceae bacterium]